jgi:hypothetical protein
MRTAATIAVLQGTFTRQIIAAILPVKILAALAIAIAFVFALKALVAGPSLDQRPIHCEVLIAPSSPPPARIESTVTAGRATAAPAESTAGSPPSTADRATVAEHPGLQLLVVSAHTGYQGQ